MDRKILRKGWQIWNNSDIPASLNKYNRRQWYKAIQNLGDKWILLKKIERIDDANYQKG